MKTICHIELPIVTNSPNKLLRMHWTKRYKLQKDYGYLLNAAIKDRHRANFNTIRRVEICSYRKKSLDPDNLYGSVKLLLDAIQEVGLIWDDSPEFLSLQVEQKIDRGNPRTEITIQEV